MWLTDHNGSLKGLRVHSLLGIGQRQIGVEGNARTRQFDNAPGICGGDSDGIGTNSISAIFSYAVGRNPFCPDPEFQFWSSLHGHQGIIKRPVCRICACYIDVRDVDGILCFDITTLLYIVKKASASKGKRIGRAWIDSPRKTASMPL